VSSPGLWTPRPGCSVPWTTARHKDGSWRRVDSIRTNLLNDPAVRGGGQLAGHNRAQRAEEKTGRKNAIGR